MFDGSLKNQGDAARAVEGVEVVYHLGAAFQGGGPFTDEEYLEINMRATLSMLEAAGKAGGLTHCIFASSDALYDKYVSGGHAKPINELTSPIAKGAYPLSEALGEELCKGY